MTAFSWTRVCYTAMAPFYDALVRGFREKRRRSIELLDLRPGERVLIVGAGPGPDLDLLPRGLEVHAVDFTPAMIGRLRRRAARLGVDVASKVMDARALEYPDGTFDAVVLHLILAVASDPNRCAREAARVLRPGGRAAILDKLLPGAGPAPVLLRLLDPVARSLGTGLARRMDPVLEGTGLRIVREEPAALKGWFRIVILENAPADVVAEGR